MHKKHNYNNMIQCEFPYDDGEVSNLDNFTYQLTRRVKFKDFELEGKSMFNHWNSNSTAVLILSAESIIEAKTRCNVGELLLAEVNPLGDLNISPWLSYDIHNSLKKGFYGESVKHRDEKISS